MCKCGGGGNKPRTSPTPLMDPRSRSIFDPPMGGVNDPRRVGQNEDPSNDPRLGANDPRARGANDPRVAGRQNADPRTNGSLAQQLLAAGQLSEQNLQAYLAGRQQHDLASALRVHAT